MTQYIQPTGIVGVDSAGNAVTIPIPTSTVPPVATPTPIPSAWKFGHINVRDFGARGDTQKVYDAVCNGTSTITSASANFKATDAGKRFFCIEQATGKMLVDGTIIAVTSPTTVTASKVCPNHTMSLTWGTDDTVALRNAHNAAKLGNGLRQGTSYNITSSVTVPVGLYVPGGGYLFSSLIFDDTYPSLRPSVNVIGDGSDKTIFYIDGHAFTFPASGGGGLMRANGNTGAATFQGFTVDGSGYDFANRQVNAGSLYSLFMASSATLNDVQVRETRGLYAGILSQSGCNLNNVWAVKMGNRGIVLDSGTYHLRDVGGSNAVSGAHENILFTNILGGVYWSGSLNDEGQKPSARLHNCKNVWISGLLMYGNEALSVTGNSSVRLSNCALEPFDLNPGTALKIEAGSIVRSLNCWFKGRGANFPAIFNDGTFEDLGGNEVQVLDGAPRSGGSGVFRTAQPLF